MNRGGIVSRVPLKLRMGIAVIAAMVVMGCQGREISDFRKVHRSSAIASEMLKNPATTVDNRFAGPTRESVDENAQALTFTIAGSNSALVLYDVTGTDWRYLGELYAVGATNLAGHFGGVTVKPASQYVCGEIEKYSALIYQGSTYDEPLPTCLLDNVMATRKPIVWAGFNIWRLVDWVGFNAFVGRFGWTWKALDQSAVSAVQYKGRTLTRDATNQAGIMDYVIYDGTKAQALAQAVRADGSTFPWAIRSDNLTYVGEIPFTYMREEDRYLVFADLLFDALAPATAERHRALVRIEDIDPTSDATELRAAADYLASVGVPFGFAVISEYKDPLGYYDGASSTKLTKNSAVATAIKYLISKGGVMVEHGQTHQYSNVLNPYTAVTGDDTEFFRVTEDAAHMVQFQGPLPGDTQKWAQDRITKARSAITGAGLPTPTIFEFPHYTASANSYKAAAAAFRVRWERSLYFSNQLKGGTIDHSRWFGQLFPYAVRDVYGSVVLPENLGNIEPEPFYQYPARSPADLINAAEKVLVVRDGVAAFYYHPFFSLDSLKQTVEGIKALGYTFVNPSTVIADVP